MSRDIAQLTSKELSALEDALNAERLLIKKYKTYALLSTDPQIKTSRPPDGTRIILTGC